MIDVDIQCATCGDSLDIVREWTDGGGLHVTVKPCTWCVEQAVETAVAEQED